MYIFIHIYIYTYIYIYIYIQIYIICMCMLILCIYYLLSMNTFDIFQVFARLIFNNETNSRTLIRHTIQW